MSTAKESRAAVEEEIRKVIPVERFLEIHRRIALLRQEEEEKLKALAELQQYYVAATNEQQQDSVKEAVGQIREISKLARNEIRELNTELSSKMSLEDARHLYHLWLASE